MENKRLRILYWDESLKTTFVKFPSIRRTIEINHKIDHKQVPSINRSTETNSIIRVNNSIQLPIKNAFRYTLAYDVGFDFSVKWPPENNNNRSSNGAYSLGNSVASLLQFPEFHLAYAFFVCRFMFTATYKFDYKVVGANTAIALRWDWLALCW